MLLLPTYEQTPGSGIGIDACSRRIATRHDLHVSPSSCAQIGCLSPTKTSKQCVHPRPPFVPQESKKTSSKRDLDEYDDLNDDSKPEPAAKSLKTAPTSTASKAPVQQPQRPHQKPQPQSRPHPPHSGTSAVVNRKSNTALTHGASLVAGVRGSLPHGSKPTGNSQQNVSKGSLHNSGRAIGSSNGAGQVAGFRPNGSAQGLHGKQTPPGQRLQGAGARLPMQGKSYDL